MKASNLLIALSLLCSSLLQAESQGEPLDRYLSDSKQQQFDYDYKKIEAESSKLRDSWIAPIMLQYSYSKSNPYDAVQTSQNAAIKMDQPIFQFGGIYYGVQFVNASKVYSDYSIDVAKRQLTKEAISLLMQIKQMGLMIDKQNLLIKNSEISLEQQKEQYLNGQLDSGFLDNAIITRNIVIQALYDMQTNKQRLISTFETMSDLKHDEIQTPRLELIDEVKFLENNIVLKMIQSEIEKSSYNKKVTMAKYFPRISFTAGYNWSKSQNQRFSPTLPAYTNEKNYYDYGIRASMPLDINTFRDIESSRVDYLKSKVVVEDKKRELKSLFEQVMLNISNYEKKIALGLESRKIYEKLLVDTVDLYKAGYKTNYDVELLKNSVDIQTIDSQIFEIDKQLELLSLYEMYKND